MRKIVVLATGGTIAGTSATGDNVGYSAAQLGIEELLARVPGLAARTDAGIEFEQVAQVDSKDMSFAIWRELAQRCARLLARDDVQGVVITHGTDTLEETAFFLGLVLDARKPVVITCAMRPATALASDGPQNILDAFALVSTPGARGVLANCAGVVHTGRDIAKRHTYRLDAFSSGDDGPLGYVEEGCLRRVRDWPAVPDATVAAQRLRKFLAAADFPQVEIVTSHTSATGSIVDALVARGVDGIVVAGTGNGSVHESLLASLLKAQEAGVRVVRSTRCAEGVVISPKGAPIPDSGGLSPAKARIAMVLELLR